MFLMHPASNSQDIGAAASAQGVQCLQLIDVNHGYFQLCHTSDFDGPGALSSQAQSKVP